MRKHFSLLLALLMAAVMTGCTANADQRTGEAEGYGGTLRVRISMNGTDITAVEVIEHNETEGVGTRAIEALPDAIVSSDTTFVDNVSGATITSEAIKTAVNMAIGGTAGTIDIVPGPDDTDASPLKGIGMAATGRVGPGTDDEGNQVYSFNVVFAHGTFDQDGRIQSIDVDQLEVLSSQFSGFPDDAEGEESFMNEITAWTTKGAQGDDYMLTSGSWRQQMDAYEQMMAGKTIDEVNSWFSTYFDQETGKPYTEGESYDALSDTDKATLTDITSGATMSLRGEHGDILLAIQRAWEDAQRGGNMNNGTDGMTENATDSQTNLEDGTMVDTNTQVDTMESEEALG
ncbi:MAG: FMN-binding protein [Clostridia bacterium]|nr:FMN-binding protein [Clostridia bacterium]